TSQNPEALTWEKPTDPADIAITIATICSWETSLAAITPTISEAAVVRATVAEPWARRTIWAIRWAATSTGMPLSLRAPATASPIPVTRSTPANMPPAPVISTTEAIGPIAESVTFSISDPSLPAPQPRTNIETTTV